MALLEHVAFKARDLGRTQAFYELLGAETSLRGERLFATFHGETRLIFDRSETAPDVGALAYLGLELESFEEVDALFARLSEQPTSSATYASNTGTPPAPTAFS